MSVRGADWNDVESALEAAGIDTFTWRESVQHRFTEALMQAIANTRETTTTEIYREVQTNAATHAVFNLLCSLVDLAITGATVHTISEEEKSLIMNTGFVNPDMVNEEFLKGLFGQ